MTIRMRDVSGKKSTARRAVAEGFVVANPETIRKIRQGKIGKGDVVAGATLAGITGAKRASEIIPLCHPVRIDHVVIDIRTFEKKIRIACTVRGKDRTGMEMEAMAGVASAALTLYDMCKPEDPGMRITEIGLVEKSGGKSGRWRRKLHG